MLIRSTIIHRLQRRASRNGFCILKKQCEEEKPGWRNTGLYSLDYPKEKETQTRALPSSRWAPLESIDCTIETHYSHVKSEAPLPNTETTYALSHTTTSPIYLVGT